MNLSGEPETISDRKTYKVLRAIQCCDNCKHRLKVLEMEILDLDEDELREPCNVCNNYDKWEIWI